MPIPPATAHAIFVWHPPHEARDRLAGVLRRAWRLEEADIDMGGRARGFQQPAARRSLRGHMTPTLVRPPRPARAEGKRCPATTMSGAVLRVTF